MIRRTRRRVAAAAILLASWPPALASVVLAWVFELPELPVPGTFLAASPELVQSRFDDIGVTVALIYGALGAALVTRRPHPVVALLVVHAVGSALAALGVQWTLLAERVPDLPGQGVLIPMAAWGYLPGTIATTIIPLLLLGGRMPTGHRVLVGFGLALSVVATATAIGHQVPGAARNPLAYPEPAQGLLDDAYAVEVTVGVSLSVVVAVIAAVRWARAAGLERRRLGWLVVGHGFLTLSYGLLIIPASFDVPGAVASAGMIFPVLGQIFYPSAILVLVLGPRLRDVDATVSRVLTATILVIAAIGGYVVASAALESAGWSSSHAGLAAALLVALGLIPGRDRLRRDVERLVWGDGDDPATLVRRLGERVGELEAGDAGLVELSAALRRALRIGRVDIVSADGGDADIAPVAGPAVAVELRAGGEVVGRLVAAPREGERLGRGTRRELAELAPLVAVAVSLVRANARLEAARDVVLAVRDRERRALRRELHDGLGPSLAGIGFGLAAVERQAATSPEVGAELAGRLAADLRTRAVEVRALVRAIRGAESGDDLGTELAELARDFSAAGPEIVADLADADAVPVAARAGLSLLASEAVHNAVRHARATTIRLAVRRRGPEVVLEVADDGVGFDPAGSSREGLGLTTMRERAAELGARFELDALPGRGTAVRVALPVPSPETETP